jgi:hypothetical protein
MADEAAREFNAGLASALPVLFPKMVFAQKTGSIPRIGVISVEADGFPVFERGMRDAGWINDVNVQLDYRLGGNDPQITTPIIRDTLGLNPSIIVTVGSPNTLAPQTCAQRCAASLRHSTAR